jgi:hypothetical protein
VSTDEHRADIDRRMAGDIAGVLREHGFDPEDGCLVDCLTDAAMMHVDELLVQVKFDE